MLRKKFVFVVLLIVMVSIVGACARAKSKEDVISVVDKFSKAICSGDTGKIEKLIEASRTDQELSEYYFYGYDLLKEDREVYLAILQTLTYEIDESTYSLDSRDSASIDVTFSVVDYRDIITDNTLFSVNEILEELAKEDSRIDTEVSVELYLYGEKWKIGNTKNILTNLFDEIHDIKISVVADLTRLIDHGICNFNGFYYNDRKNIYDIEYYLVFRIFNDVEYKYYYEFYFEDELVEVSPIGIIESNSISARENTYFYDDVTTNSGVPFIDETSRLFLSGNYTYKFYDENGVLFHECSFDLEFVPDNIIDFDKDSVYFSWYGDYEENNVLYSPYELTLRLHVGDEYKNSIIIAYFTIDYNGELIYTSDSEIYYCFTGFTDFAFTEFPSIDDGWPKTVQPGEYTMRIYSDDTHQLIFEDTCIVY